MSVITRWRSRISLIAGTDIPGTDKRLRDGATLSPEDMWLLAGSALLASIGLDQDSVAVIIGAMLISPLMGPILAVGLGVGTWDRALLVRGVRELAIATAAGLLISALYFWISPLAEPTAQLLSRTRPTLLDVGVALVGGVAGIVAGSRRSPSLALPGVAIATALMPPLCTAGFGLATGRPAFFFGGLYLFIINAIFISVATFLVVRALRFPEHTFVDATARSRGHRLVAAAVILAAAPSLYFLYRSVTATREHQHADQFVRHFVDGPDREVIRWEFAPDGNGRDLRVYVAGRPLDGVRADSMRTALAAQGFGPVTLHLLQSELSASDVARLRTDAVQGVMAALEKNRERADSATGIATRADRARTASRELAVTFREIEHIIYAEVPDAVAPAGKPQHPALIIEFRGGTRTAARRATLERARALVAQRFPADSFDVRTP